MIGGELLRLRKKRGFITLVLLAVIAPVVIAFGYDVIAHASDPATHGPAGGLHNYTNMLVMLGVYMGPVAAILIGAEAGAGDLAVGVFRDNVLTGRSRTALFLARIPAALAVSLSVTAIGFLIGVAGTFAFAGGLSTPSVSLILESAGWLALANGVVCVVAIGLGSLTGSRPGTITALLGWQLVLSPLLLGSTSLGSIRRPLLDGADAVPPVRVRRTVRLSVAMSAGIAIVVLALWIFVIPSLGCLAHAHTGCLDATRRALSALVALAAGAGLRRVTLSRMPSVLQRSTPVRDVIRPPPLVDRLAAGSVRQTFISLEARPRSRAVTVARYRCSTRFSCRSLRSRSRRAATGR